MDLMFNPQISPNYTSASPIMVLLQSVLQQRPLLQQEEYLALTVMVAHPSLI